MKSTHGGLVATAILSLAVSSAAAEQVVAETPNAAATASTEAQVEPVESETPATPETAAPPPHKRAEQVSSLELWASAGPSIVFGEPANPGYTQSFRRAGGMLELGIAYRSSYFVDPFLSVSYANLAGGESLLPSGPWGNGGTLEQTLAAWVISPGITSDIWRFRLRLGLGLAVIAQNNRFQGQSNTSTQLPLAHQLGIGFNALDTDRFRLDAEARAFLAPGADVSFVALALVARGDLVQFGR